MLFRACFADGVLQEERARQIVAQMLQSRPRGFLSILAQFQRLVKLEIERRTAKVESAIPLTPELKSTVEQSLVKRYGAGLHLSFSENPALLGGMRIKVGSDVYDGSVQGRLAAVSGAFR